MAKKKSNSKNNKDAKKGKQSDYGKQKRLQNSKDGKTKDNSSSFLDTRAKRDITGVVFILLGVVILAIALIPTNAPLALFFNSIFRFCFGCGIFILPIVSVLVGITFFMHMEKQNLTLRVTVGMSLIFVAILTLISLTSPPIANFRYEELFNEEIIKNFGGIIGSSLSWVSATLLGPEISAIIFVGVAIAGLIVVGFSISGLIKRLNEKRIDSDNLVNLNNQSGNNAYTKHYKDNVDNKNVLTNALFDNDGNVIIDNEGNIVRVDNGQFSSVPTSSIDPGLIDNEGKVINSNNIDEPSKNKTNKIFAIFKRKNKNDYQTNEDINFNPYQKDTQIIDNPKNNIDNNKKANNTSKTQILDTDNNDTNNKNKQTNKNTSTLNKPTKKSPTTMAAATPKPQDGFELPSMDILEDPVLNGVQISDNDLKQVANELQKTLSDFGISANVVGWVAGPTVTLFKIDLPSGIRVSRITALNDDIALALAAPGVRVFAPIPGTTYVGIEVPNSTRQTVLLKEVLTKAKRGPLQIAIGKDVEGHGIVSDLAKMPHLLIGGTTGSGKSVLINAMIMSILMRSTPSEVKFILIDPKRVEFMPYNGIPHLYVPVVTEPKEAASALSWGVAEMERRLKLFAENGVRNIGTYNAKVQRESNKVSGNKDNNKDKTEGLEELPYIVIVIDELADLMMAMGKEVEFSISRIAQLARAAGIHLIVATQRPSTNVVTGLIKANITNRIAFNVASGIDSRVILDTGGAENLIGLGDMLFSKPEFSKPLRIQGCYLSEDEVSHVVEHLKGQAEPEYHNDILKTNLVTIGDSDPHGGPSSQSNSDDELFWSAAEMIIGAGSGSTSSLQRRFKIGYARAGRIMDRLEEMGVVGPQCGSKPREVLMDSEELEILKNSQIDDDIMQDY